MQDLAELSEIRISQAFPRLLGFFYNVFFEHMLQQVASWGGLFKDKREKVVTSGGWSSFGKMRGVGDPRQ